MLGNSSDITFFFLSVNTRSKIQIVKNNNRNISSLIENSYNPMEFLFSIITPCININLKFLFMLGNSQDIIYYDMI